jgi:hypothetical protein
MFKTFIGINKLDRERNQSLREKLGVQNIFLKIQQYQENWLQNLELRESVYQNNHYSISQKGEKAWTLEEKKEGPTSH